MKSIFEAENYTELVNRIQKLSTETEAKWGKMNSAQMMHHCQMPFEIPLGKREPVKMNFIMRMMVPLFKKSMYNDKPWKPNMMTAPGFSVLGDRDFDTEKSKLLEISNEFSSQGDKEWGPHPAFGSFTNQQWGQMQYKHLDHHLRQFGV